MSVIDGVFRDEDPEFWRDVLRGADAIAEFLYGDPKQRRKVYYLCEKTNFPHYVEGSRKCARRSSIRRWIEEQEWKNTGRPRKTK